MCLRLQCYPFAEADGVMEWWSIAKYQIPILNNQNRFGIWNFGRSYLFDI